MRIPMTFSVSRVNSFRELGFQSGCWQVPREHPEIARLEGRYKSQGGLRDGMLVELANGETALVVAIGKQSVRLDANNMMAGKSRVFELELVALEPGR